MAHLLNHHDAAYDAHCAGNVGVHHTKELKLLDRLVQQPANQATASADLSSYVRKLACLGGYLARSHDPPPGNTVIWRGLSRVTEIELGFQLALETVGN
jgi:hypothetical protein